MIEMKELPRARAAGILYAQSCCLAELPNSSPADRGAASVAAGLDSLLSRRLQALAARPAARRCGCGGRDLQDYTPGVFFSAR